MKNNKLNLKYFILVVFIIAVIFSIPTARAEINNNISASNQQLIILLKQLITLLIQQVEELTKQLTAQQQAINNLNNAVFQPISTQSTTPALNSTIQQLASPYFVVEISSDKNAVQNNGVDYATLTIIAKLSDGQIFYQTKLLKLITKLIFLIVMELLFIKQRQLLVGIKIHAVIIVIQFL